MEAGEENGNNMGLKRQRAPLSDSEDNNCSAPETNDSQKRRRLEAAGQENHCPEASSSGRRAELETKPDTPIVPSVRSRVQQLTQRRDGGAPPAQRCLSDPGGDSKGHKEPLLGEAEFNQRMERFKMASFQSSPTNTPSPANQYPRTRSSFVSVIQQKLQGSTTPSSKQVSRIRQEREHELSQVPFQPIAENAWLKRSSSDSALAEERTPCGPSGPSSSVPRSKRRVQWPPTCLWDDQGVADVKDGSFTEPPTTNADSASLNMTDTEVSFREETNTGEIIDQMFEEVLEYAERMEGPEDHDSGIGACSVENDKMETEKEKSEEEGEAKEEKSDESDKVDGIRDELLNFPPTGILSPLSKSVEAVVTPLRLAASQEPIPPLLLTPEETSAHPAESAPLYSIDAYRTQRQSKLPIVQSVTPGVQRRAEETPKPQPPVNIKEKITALNEEAGKLQTVINQTLQALNCCTDEEHGRGSLEEAEAEKLLLVSCEKRSALLAEVARLKEERSSESGEAAVEDSESISQQPCRGTVSITNIQLPLKVEYVCSSHNRAGRPSHYFFVLIRYGPCNIVATPLATAADAQNGDTISFPTSVTMKDIRSSFEIDVEVYSLSQTSASNCTMERASTKPRVTPRKLLNTLTQRSSVSSTSAAPPLITRRSSNFCLVGSHKITLASLGHSKFPLDKMKLDGKVRRLLGDEFQEKVPFLSPLEGNIYLQLESKSHSDVQHQGFLTMFELISGYGVWHRCFFVLEECNLYYWNYPNDRETKEAEGSISLSSSQSQCVRPVKRELCARPFTFELVSSVSQQEQDLSQDAAAKCWFSADTKQERLDWMEKLNQALLDFHTWNRTQTESQQANTSSSGNLRESIL
ncbi:anillin, actin binding protein 2 isoform X6 [Astatotilapia calliptera]|uniref:PH domain-containing protein n=1 Tax=Astatotilapia calliptera TaxID=8154 RepID=A0A3P8NPS2_ASTCA|nr:anillin isoform X6 [Maylandia zebra]XP_026028387.1 anillin-like isoform X6 [Astatotilapia calliptera]